MSRSLLAAMLVALVASCSVDHHGLSAVDASHPGTGAAGHPMGAAGTSGAAGAAGSTSDLTGAAGADASAGSTGSEPDAAAGTTGASGAAGATATGGAGAAGAAGTSSAGAGGSVNPAGGAGAPGTAGASTGGAGGMATAGTSGTAGSVMPAPGCSDGSREGFVDMNQYLNIAACSGAWDEPGLDSTDSRTPLCDRQAGNDGDKPDGRGCSVADLCASGWRVCETAHAVTVATNNAGCDDALTTFGARPVFFLTRQRASLLVCDPTNQTGVNNVYGCGNIGSAADKSCAPFTHMLRDSDCQSQYPWTCSDGPVGTADDEYDVVTKQSAGRGGVLCCRY